MKYNTKLVSVNGEEFVKEVVVKEESEYALGVSAVFPILGDNPDTKFVEKLEIVNEKKYVEINDTKETKIKGIYAVGDCTTTLLKQIVTASSDGAIAALEVYKYIKSIK